MMATDAGRCDYSSSGRGGRGDRGLVLSRHERVWQRDVFVQGNEGARGDKSKNEVAVLIEERCLSTAPLPQSARRACARPGTQLGNPAGCCPFCPRLRARHRRTAPSKPPDERLLKFTLFSL